MKNEVICVCVDPHFVLLLFYLLTYLLTYLLID